jgi:branched-chain amino acid aminotransferase
MNVVYLRNTKVEPQEKVSLFNPTFLYGINVFEGIRAYWSEERKVLRIFDLDDHLKRLYRSAKFLDFKVPVSKNILRSELLEIINTEDINENVYIRITFFIDSETNWSEENSIERLISIRSIESNLGFSHPQSLAVSSFKRISSNSMPPSVKAGANYLNSRYALLNAKKRGFEGALFLTQDNLVSESTGSCIFFIKNDVLYTPSVSSDILLGITRNRIIELARCSGIEIFEDKIGIKDLSTFEAAFLVGTMIELKPISRIEEIVYDPSHNIITKLIILLKNYVYGTEV